MSSRLSPQQVRVWEHFHVIGETVRREVGRDLFDQSQLTEADFTVLAELSQQARGSMRSSECARAIDWEVSRLSHQARRMEERGLIARERGDATDGRASTIVLTDAGRRAYRQALGPHLQSARRWFLDGLTPAQLDQLDDILTALHTHTQNISGTTSSPREAAVDAQGEP